MVLSFCEPALTDRSVNDSIHPKSAAKTVKHPSPSGILPVSGGLTKTVAIGRLARDEPTESFSPRARPAAVAA